MTLNVLDNPVDDLLKNVCLNRHLGLTASGALSAKWPVFIVPCWRTGLGLCRYCHHAVITLSDPCRRVRVVRGTAERGAKTKYTCRSLEMHYILIFGEPTGFLRLYFGTQRASLCLLADCFGQGYWWLRFFGDLSSDYIWAVSRSNGGVGMSASAPVR